MYDPELVYKDSYVIAVDLDYHGKTNVCLRISYITSTQTSEPIRITNAIE